MRKITRIAYNSAHWRKPTGEAGAQEIGGTYNNVNGFGHEDWLFRNEWLIDGWRYAFLQGVGKSHKKLIREKLPFDLNLYTVQTDKRRRYVAAIDEVECLDDRQAEAALETFRQMGWFDLMKAEIEAINGKVEALGSPQWARHVLNVRFRLQNVRMLPEDSFAAVGDPIWKLHRYVLTESPVANDAMERIRGRRGTNQSPNLESYARKGTCSSEVTPEHALMQARLMAELQEEFPTARVVREENYIDVVVENDTDLRLYEIKSDLSPRTVLRHAIGQLLEYAHFQANPKGRNLHLVVVGRTPPSQADAAYINQLKQRFSLPLAYRVVHI